MTKKLLCVLMLLCSTIAFSQSKLWQQQSATPNSRILASKQNLPKAKTYSLNITALKQTLANAPSRGNSSALSNIIISFPNAEGQFEQFRISEASNMHPDLAAQYPNIKSYSGQGIDDSSAVIRFSVSPLGFQSMRLSANSEASFIEPLTADGSLYAAYKRADKSGDLSDFECSVTDVMNKTISTGDAMRNADDGVLRRYRLAMSVTGEYTQYFGGTKANALAAINATMTRVNGIFENDFNCTMQLIANTDAVIYTNASTDPYSTSDSQWNSQLQSTLNNVIGSANYDIGHLMGATGNNGNAGCIGCVCVNNQKGSGYTTSTVPTGDNFDVDFVAHEIGHQFGANHTFTFSNESGTGAQMEPGSGSTIMGYAGITGATDVQAHSDPYFHARSIEQVTNYVKTTSCQTNVSTGNATPSANAGANYTIPKGTPFVLTGSGSDSNSGDVLTYCWEQYNTGSSSNTNPSVNATSGAAFRSYNPSTDTKRYFPRLSTIKTGATSWQWEAVPNVARTMNFRLTVRDNRAGGASNNSDDNIITVNGTAGPFVVNAPNTNVTWNAGTSQTVTWSVAGTTGNGVNAANVDILLSTDGGDTYPITLVANTPNDGSQAITVPNNQGSQNRIMVKGSNHIFFDISNSNFTIAGTIACNATVPTSLAASNVGSSAATLNWNSVAGATYDLRYRVVGSTTWTTIAVSSNSSNLTGLSATTQYEAQVRSKCSGGTTSSYSSSTNFTTTVVQLNYCASASTNVNDEYISRVQLNTINNASGAQFYSNFTSISTNLNKGTQYTVTVTPTWTGSVYTEAYAVWIDYNKDGDFTDAGEQVWSQAPTNVTPVSGNFTVPTGATTGATRMRVAMKYNALPTACESFQYGEVEDYTVNIQGSAPDTQAPTAPTNLIASGTTQSTTNLSWNVSSDNVGVSGYDVLRGSTVIATVTGTTYQASGLSASTTYSFTVKAKDAAGNVSSASNSVSVTTLAPPDTTAPSVPSTLTASGTTQSTTNLSWSASTDNVGVTGYDVYQGSTVIATVTGTTRQVTGLTANTAYSFRVRAKDAAGNISGYSNTATVTTLPIATTGCSSGISSFPYTEGFENTLGAWTQSTADDIDWTINSNGTPSGSTGPSSAAQGTYYIFVEASSPNYPSKRALLNSPCFDLSGKTSAAFNFQYHMYGAADMGTIALEASTNNGSTWTSIWSQSGNKGNTWLTANVDLASYVGGTVQLRFNRNVGSTWQADIAIDDVSLTASGGSGTTCNSGNVNLSITFDNYPEETAWTLKNATGTTVASATYSASNADGSTVTRTFSGLAGGTYTFTITDVYGDGMCCTYGSGSYTLTGSLGTIVSGGSFGASEATTFCMQSTVKGEADQSAENSFNEVRLYPNPVTNGILNLAIPGHKTITYAIVNMIGKTVLRGTTAKEINVERITSGMYIINIYNDDQLITKKFIKK